MPIKIQIAKILPIAKRERALISPQEKFNRLSRRLKNKGNKFKLRKYHFNAISSVKVITVFDGEGIEVFQGENSINGCRVARQYCLAIFLSAENQNGGFNWTMDFNPEFQTLEELREAELATRRNLDYKPFIVCLECKFQFETNVELGRHICTEQFMILEFHCARRIRIKEK